MSELSFVDVRAIRLAGEAAIAECKRAVKLFPGRSMLSPHDGLGIIQEEYEELKDWVFMKGSKRDLEEMRKEATQLAAMAIRFLVDICNEEKFRI